MVKPEEESDTRISNEEDLSQSSIADRVSLYQGGGTLTYKWNLDSHGSNLHLAGDYLYREDGYKSRYRPAVGEEESSRSKSRKNSFSFKADADILFKDDVSSLSTGLYYQQMDARQHYEQQLQANRFGYGERLYGAYGEFDTSLADETFDLSLGLRYEGARIDWDYSDRNLNGQNGKDAFDDFFPSASLTYNTPSGKAYTSLSYERSISRPIMAEYDPTVYRDGDNVYTVGASHLLPEFENTLSLTQGFGQSLTLALSYIWQNDIYDVVYRKSGDDLYMSSDNIGSSRKAELYIDSRFWIVKNRLSARLSATGEYASYKSLEYGKTDCLHGDISARLGLSLPHAWRIFLTGSYSTRELTVTERISEGWGVHAALSKSIGSRFILQLSGRNLFYNKKLSIISRQPDVHFESYTFFPSRSLSLSLTYNFGSRKLNQVKQTQTNYEMKIRSGVK